MQKYKEKRKRKSPKFQRVYNSKLGPIHIKTSTIPGIKPGSPFSTECPGGKVLSIRPSPEDTFLKRGDGYAKND